MPSRAELRVTMERGLRGLVIIVLALMLWQALHKQPPVTDNDVRSHGLGGAFPRWSAAPVAPRSIHVELDSVPTLLERDWLKALAAAGSQVAWSGDLPAMMIAVQPVASPIGGVKVKVAAPTGSSLELRDEVAIIDTVQAQNAGASVTMSSAVGGLTARIDHSTASTRPADSVTLHKVMVIGDAGWESKFVIAALEEDGWKVDAFIRVAPGIDVTQGAIAAIDTSRFSAVVALDAAAAPYAGRIASFARSGGGVVMTPAAAALESMAPLRIGGVGRTASVARTISTEPVNLATLSLSPITGLRDDAVVLDRRTGGIAMAVRRVGAGRALQLGYEDTWRWRMGGGDNSVREHRLWWTGVVSSVAYAPRRSGANAFRRSDDAPVAELVAAIGPRTNETTVANRAINRSHWMIWLFIILSLSLIAEVASRRLRSAT